PSKKNHHPHYAEMKTGNDHLLTDRHIAHRNNYREKGKPTWQDDQQNAHGRSKKKTDQGYGIGFAAESHILNLLILS
ncbi:MAG: hypothetical protein ACXWMI_03270, partial [Syntrophales bacterium]